MDFNTRIVKWPGWFGRLSHWKLCWILPSSQGEASPHWLNSYRGSAKKRKKQHFFSRRFLIDEYWWWFPPPISRCPTDLSFLSILFRAINTIHPPTCPWRWLILLSTDTQTRRSDNIKRQQKRIVCVVRISQKSPLSQASPKVSWVFIYIYRVLYIYIYINV